MECRQSSVRSIRFTRMQHRVSVRASSPSRINRSTANCRSMHSCKSLTGGSVVRVLYEEYSNKMLSADDFLEQYGAQPPFVKHTRLDQLNTFSRQFLRFESLFSNNALRGLARQLQQESASNRVSKERLCDLIGRVIECCTTSDIFDAYWSFKNTCQGFSLQAMALNFGAHLYMVSSRYPEAHDLLSQLLRLILHANKDEFLAVYLRLRIVALCNQTDNVRAIGYLKKLVKVAWLFELTDMELWCYHQLSKLYMAVHEQQFARVMNSKAEQGLSEGATKYRSIMCEVIAEELQKMKKSYCDFDLAAEEIDVLMMRRNPLESLACEPNFKEVRLLATKLGRSGEGRLRRLLPKLFQERRKTKDEEEVQASLLMTHLSKLKNFNCFFRGESSLRTSSDGLITIENPNVNWLVLREMLRRIAQECLPLAAC